ncbi:MAG TPA: CpsD/CapB family tyrosine-protein kinase [Burkholderiales bacterium]|nr:CpsD/CapB family tyrosine-protein kinase [Burkholderiales bacterium]
MKGIPDWRPLALALCVALAAAYACNALAPRIYVATARVLLPKPGVESRVVKLERAARDAAEARTELARLLGEYSDAAVIDAPAIVAGSRSLGVDLAIGAALGLGFGAGFTLWRERRRRPVRVERDLVPLLGNPLLAARPHQPEALRALARQLGEHWFRDGRKLLPVVSAGKGDGRSSVARELATLFAQMGERTLLIDADLRSPSVHRAFHLKNKGGLADLLADRPVQLAACRDNLAVLVAGTTREHPLELLSRPRLLNFLAAAARPFDVVLIDTPAAEAGPDLEIFAALAGGALLVVRPGEDAARLSQLRRQLTRCAARPVATVFSHHASVFSR